MPLEELIMEKQIGGTYGPATMKAMAQAFEEAWAEVAPYYSQHPLQTELYRSRLANAVLEVTKLISIRVEDIKMRPSRSFRRASGMLCPK